MSKEIHSINRAVSILYRQGQRYFDARLSPYRIGCGQQFFLLLIHECPGISPFELASRGAYDKGTTARAIKKLEEEGYIQRVQDTEDKRMCKLYETETAAEVIKATREVLRNWQTLLTEDLGEEDAILAGHLLNTLAEKAEHTMKPKRKQD